MGQYECKKSSNHICDPDEILTEKQRNDLDTQGKEIEKNKIEEKHCSKPTGFKFATSLIEKLSFTGDKQKAFKSFCEAKYK